MFGEQRRCQSCSQSFRIEPEDFAFYDKIGVPPPTWCPECRMIRRMIWRNEMMLYKRGCDFTGDAVFSGYSQDKPFKVYKRDIWYSDRWDPMTHTREYDLSRSFFDQFGELFRAVPLPNQSLLRAIDSDYCNNASDIKRCYLLFNSEFSENCAYGDGITACREVYDSYFMKNVEQAYEGFACFNSSLVFYSSDIYDSHDVYFSKDLVGCAYCFGCVGLRNKSYYIFNQPVSGEEYFKKFNDFNLGSHIAIESIQERAEKFHITFPRRFMRGRHNVNVSGNYITNSRNVHNSFYVDEFENSAYCYHMGLKPTKECYDFCWGGTAELTYEAVSMAYGGRLKFIFECWPDDFDISYSIFCSGSSNLFGCVGLRNKSYCILNKQYSKEEYAKLVPRIIQHMNQMPYVDARGRVYRYGEFFPPELSPFAYNETIAQEYFPLTKEQALEQGYAWRDPKPRDYEITMPSDQLPDHIKDVSDSILSQTIACAHAPVWSSTPNTTPNTTNSCNEQCTTAFRIIPQELEFYRKMNLPLPHFCPNCRHYQRLRQRNPLKLWKRRCTCGGSTSHNGVYKNTANHPPHSMDQHCLNEFETSYAHERKEIVYCEQCYQSEVI